MSAINIIVRDEAVHVLTDGAGYTPDGKLVSKLQKVMPLGQLDLVVAVRGNTWILPKIGTLLNETCDGFDDAVERFPAAWQYLIESEKQETRHLFVVGLAEVFVAGISAQGGGRAYVFVNSAQYGLPAHEMVSLADGVVLPADLKFLDGLPSLGLSINHQGFDPMSDGLRLLEEQRARAWPIGFAGKPVRAVGGFAQLTTVRRSEITTRILKRWPDALSEFIGNRS